MSKKLRITVEIILPDDAFEQHKMILALEPSKQHFENALKQILQKPVEVEASVMTIVHRSSKAEATKPVAVPAAAE